MEWCSICGAMHKDHCRCFKFDNSDLIFSEPLPVPKPDEELYRELKRLNDFIDSQRHIFDNLIINEPLPPNTESRESFEARWKEFVKKHGHLLGGKTNDQTKSKA